MAEKNTLSILETIKKKMHKLDQKTEKSNKIADLHDEFEYISPVKKEEIPQAAEQPKILPQQIPQQPAQEQTQKTMPEFKDDLGFEDVKKTTAETAPTSPPPAQPIVQAQPKVEGKLEDFNLDDLDLDDESNKVKSQQPAPPVTTAAEIPAAIEAVAAQVSGEDFNEEDMEDYEDEVDFAEESEVVEAQQVASEAEPIDPLNFNPELPAAETDELNLDNLEAASTTLAQQTDELNLDHLEEAIKEETPQVVPAAQPDELNLDNLEMDDDPLHLNTPEPLKETMPAAEEKHDDINLDHLDAAIVEQPKKEEHHEESHDDDLNFDDLELDEDDSAKKEQPKVVEAKKEEDPTDLELDKLEAELQRKKAEAKPVSPIDEIDLEFEKEIMGLKPEVAKEAPAQASMVQEKVTPQQPVQVQVENPLPFETKFEAMPPVQNTAQNVAPDYQKNLIQNEVSFMGNKAKPDKVADKMIYDSTMRQTTDSIKKLIDAKNVVAGISTFSQSPAFAELAVQLMEPKLERWLNDNLPDMVEKVVREEIKKIIPKE